MVSCRVASVGGSGTDFSTDTIRARGEGRYVTDVLRT